MTKKELKEVASKKEITRSDARELLIHVFDNNYYKLGEATNLHPIFLKEMLTFVKIFSEDAQNRIKQASLKLLDPKLKKKNK